MASLEELRNTRIEKINILRDAGMDPYPADVARDLSLAQASQEFSTLEESGETRSIAARVTAIRGAGAIVFVVLNDGTAEFQAVLKKDEIDEAQFQLFQDTVDMADFVWLSGVFFTTERGQQSLLVAEWKMAGKALLPLPDKWDGITDQEEIYRKRYLELVTSRDAYDRYIMRARVISRIREYLDEKGLIEIETPILQNQAGGAMARTFDTHHNDYDMPMVLRIAMEIDHKMVMAGGYPGVYEFGKNFRNEGSDPTHIQEFTMLEWYAAYHTLEDNMNWTEELLKDLAEHVVGSNTFTVYDKDGNPTEVDFGGTWPRARFSDLVKENTGLDIATASLEEIQATAREWGMSDQEIATTGRANTLDFIYKKSSRNKIINPTFVTDYPGDLKPLAQQNADGTARVTQLIIAGAEVTNQYAELVDPVRQRELLENQSEAKAAGDDEAMDVDERFLAAMEHGMPPMTGFGMGIDRLVAVFAGQKNIRDAIFFPIMRPRGPEGAPAKKENQTAVAIINTGAGLEPWQQMNTIAHLNAAFGARVGKQLFKFDSVQAAGGESIALNIQHPIMVKQADSSAMLQEKAQSAREGGLEVAEFTREMLETTNDNKIKEITSQKDLSEIEHLGVLVFGEKSKIEELTGNLELYS